MSSTLVIMRFSPHQQGNYTCVASNIFRQNKKTFSIDGERLRCATFLFTSSSLFLLIVPSA